MVSMHAVTDVRVDNAAFDQVQFSRLLRSDGTRCGAIVTFTGLVRELPDGELRAMFLEHYPGMTEKALLRIVEQARARWPLGAVVVHHRVGELHPGDEIVFVGVASAHRKAAFEAAQFIMDYLKRDAPFWKKELTGEAERWVEQKQSDLNAAASWDGADSDA